MPRVSKGSPTAALREPDTAKAYANKSALVVQFRSIIENLHGEPLADMVQVEYLWFSRTRAIVLQALYERAIEGSDVAVKIYRDWLLDNEREHDSLINSPRNVTAKAAAWTKNALKLADSKASSSVQVEPVIGVDMVEGTSSVPEVETVENVNDNSDPIT